MTRFRYRATDDQDKPVVDVMEAGSAREVTVKLQERGFTVNAVEELDRPHGLLRMSRELSWNELHLFTQQLYAITRTDLPLAPALRSLAADLKGSRLKPLLEGVRRDVENGVALDEAIEGQGNAFPRLFADIVRAGQSTGNLSGVLQLYLRHTERMLTLKDTLKMALAYPFMVVCLGALIMGFLLVKVVPVFVEIFSEFGGDLPGPTRFWLNISDLLIHRWPAIIIGVAVLIVVGHLARRGIQRYNAGRIRLDWLRLHAPVVGHLRYLLAVARFARTLSMLLASRIPLLQSLDLAAAASGSPMLQRAVEKASLRAAGGERIADALAGTGFFSYHFCWLLGMGEDRGEAETALENIADSLERELIAHDRTIGIMLAPTLILSVGLLVASLVVSLYLPIFTLGDTISGT